MQRLIGTELPLRPDDQCCYRTADKRDELATFQLIELTLLGHHSRMAATLRAGHRPRGPARLEPLCSFLPSERGERGPMGGPDSEGGQPGIHSGPNGKSKLIGIWFYLPRRCRAP